MLSQTVACHLSDGGCVDTVAQRPYGHSEDLGIDVTVINTLAPSYVTNLTAQSAQKAFDMAEAVKISRHLSLIHI